MDSAKIRQKFLDFFEKRGHKIVPSSSLIPDDPSVLLTTAGMQQFKKYYTGEADPIKDFGSKNTVSIQKSFRTSDIDEVGDDSHLTFFEMLGNFSFGYKPGEPRSPKSGYFKKEAITYAFEFITKELGLPISFVTIFEGSQGVAKDEESRAIWKSLGVEDIREQGLEDVFWGPTGSFGPCGPTTEIYCENSAGGKAEVWNIVFNEFFFSGSRAELLAGNSGKKLERLQTPGVDTGMGLERLAMIIQGKKNIFETDLFEPIIQKIVVSRADRNSDRAKRIIADHIRAIAFLIADGVRPSNKGVGYILRRLMRRVIVYGAGDTSLLDVVIDHYESFYKELGSQRNDIKSVAVEEYMKFSSALKRGLNGLEKLDYIDAQKAFWFYESFGLPYEVIKDFDQAAGLTREQFDNEFKKHQEISRAGQEKKFGGHGLILDNGELKAASAEELEKVTRLHTATHLLNAALHKVLGDEISQRGSDITSERTRFDFLFPRKLTGTELKEVERLVNEAIAKNYSVSIQEMPLEEAKKSGAMFFYKGKYPERVKVYTIGKEKEVFSKELCGGPHVKNTSEIGEFKIVKEESSSAGVRRIRAKVE